MQHQKLKTLFVERTLLNSEDLRDWAKSQGFKSILAEGDMHVTIGFSKKPVDWSLLEPIERNFTNVGGERTMEQFGDAAVLCFPSHALKDRWQELMDIGASWDFPTYRSHITITYEGDMPDNVVPYDGPLKFGPESFSEVNENWSKGVKEEPVNDD